MAHYTMRTISIMTLAIVLAGSLAACSHDDEDTQAPTVSGQGITTMPTDCQQYETGSQLPVRYILQDDVELGSYNIEVHNNFDHHSHSTSAGDCTLDGKKEANAKVWIFNRDYTIPAGSTSFTVRQDIDIPADAQPGDYHFMLRFTDRAGHQSLKAVSIKLIPARHQNQNEKP